MSSSLGGSVYASTILSMDEDIEDETEGFLQGINGLNDQQWVLQVHCLMDILNSRHMKCLLSRLSTSVFVNL